MRRHYAQEMDRLRTELFGPPQTAPRGGAPERRDGPWRDGGRAFRAQAPAGALPSTRASTLVSSEPARERAREGIVLASLLARETAETRLREEVILAALVMHPDLFGEFEDALEAIEWSQLNAATARAVIRGRAQRATCEAALGPGALETLMARSQMLPAPALRRPGDPVAARALIDGDLAKLAAHQGLRREVAEAGEDLEALVGEVGADAEENLTWRLGQAAATLDRAERALVEDRAAFDTAANGVALDRAERERARSLFEGIDFGRGGRPPRRRPDHDRR